MLAVELDTTAPPAAAETDWSDRLAADLVARPRLRIDAWAEAEGLSREHVARRFGATFGVSPTQFRTELIARKAWFRIVGASEPLSLIAAEAGYADQAHMTRAVRAFTGAPPARWRAAISAAAPERAAAGPKT
jgi:AraC-like DNA-binding protein